MISSRRIHDARKLTHEALEELRRLGVNRALAGESQPSVARDLHVTRTTVVRWMMAYRAGGEAALAARKPPGRPPTLSRDQRERLRAIIAGKSPRQCGFPMPRWSIRLVAQVIEREFDVVLHESTIARLLRWMGLVLRRPTRQEALRRGSRPLGHEHDMREWLPKSRGPPPSITCKKSPGDSL
ncbi:MAG: hypothetical protein A2V77_19165 [Anaeromyxobacter sp. RBG_16_69_14]|nr:MAG: hypothetical protein A2V77_19165 [Anaeromyxobacter sp. RBG_16_69_14]